MKKSKKLKEEKKEEKEKQEKTEEKAGEKEEIKEEEKETKLEIESLERVAERPVLTETEGDSFSEFMLSSSSEEMPTITLPSTTATTASTEPENLEASATGFRTATPADSIISGGDTMSESVYSSKVYQEYFGKSYATEDYESREKEIRDMIRREKFAKETTLPTAPIVQRRWDEVDRQANIENWERIHEEGARNYILENITKKETKKRKRIE